MLLCFYQLSADKLRLFPTNRNEERVPYRTARSNVTTAHYTI